MKSISASRRAVVRCAVRPAVGLSVRPLALAVAAALGAPLAFAGPVGPTVVNGQIQVTQPNAGTTVITQGSDKGIINWTSFSIGAGEQVQFQQPASSSVTLNRVTSSASPSAIYGSLSANGKVFLVNPAGVMFGANASVNVGGLVASTLDIADSDFLAGAYTFRDGGSAGAVGNAGTITAPDNGTIALLGAQVSNTGTITARLGTVGLAAGGQVSLDFDADGAGLTRIVVDAARVNALVQNGGALIADGGQVIMSAHALGTLTDSVVANTGVVRAQSLVERNGRILLEGGDDGAVSVGGTLDASGLDAGATGGAVTVLGQNITLPAGSVIDARGDAGGGTVMIGGGSSPRDGAPGQPSPLVQQAANLTMDTDAGIHADAVTGGDGGIVVLFSNNQTNANGDLSARGGANSGRGGGIDVTGAQVDLTGVRIDASAAAGTAGYWGLNLPELDIDTDLAAIISGTLSGGTSFVGNSIGNLHGTGSGNTFVNANIIKSGNADVTFELDSLHDIVLDHALISGSKLNVYLNADADGVAGQQGASGTGAIQLNNATIDSGGGDIRLYGQGSPTAGMAVGGGALSDGIALNASTLDSIGDNGSSGQIVLRGAGGGTTGGAGINLIGSSLLGSTGDIRIDGQGGAGVYGGAGVAISGGTLQTGSGAIRIEGQGGLGSQYAGVGTTIDFEYGGNIMTTGGAIYIHGADGSMHLVSDDPSGAARYGASGLSITMSSGSGPDASSIQSASGIIQLRGDRYLGTDEAEAALDLNLFAGQIQTGGRLEITGVARQDAAAGLSIYGNYPGATAPVLTAGAGGMLLAGYDGGGGAGLRLDSVTAATGGGGQLAVAGESAAGSGVSLSGAILGGDGMRGDIVLRAYSGGAASMLAVRQGDAPTVLQTSGTVAILPGGVDVNGNPTSHPEVPITVGGASPVLPSTRPIAIGSLPDGGQTPVTPNDSGAGGFNVYLGDLGMGGSSAAHVVIGSQEQKGAITFKDADAFTGNLTLQNDAAGSGGIVLDSNVQVSGQLTLSSGGTVSAGMVGGGLASISASSLLLHGSTPESNFQLASADNRVGAFSAWFTDPKGAEPGAGSVDFSNTGALAVLPLAGTGFSTASNGTTNLSGSGTRVAGDLVLQTSGDLSLIQDIATLDGNITLVAGDNFVNYRQHLTPGGGGDWHIFADTWIGEVRGPLTPSTVHPNLYGCTYGSACADGVAGNHFFYRQQPTLTVTPDAATRTYGDANPAISYSASNGLVNGDTLADAVSGYTTTSAQASSGVGAYATSGVFTSPVGYIITVQPGTLTVNPAALLISADNQSKVYGAADPALTASFSGFKLNDTPDVVSGLTLSTATGQAAGAGTHAITGAGASAANYTISYQGGTLTVAKAPLVVNVGDQAKTYGDADPQLSASYSGFQYGDTAALVSGLTLSTATGAAATAGTHPIDGAGASAANYSISYKPGTLTVAKAPLTLLVDNQHKQYGDADPALTYQVSGLKYDDTIGEAGTVSLSTALGAAATAGAHPIVATAGSASNYVVSAQNGTLTVDKAPLLVTANDASKVYGDADPVLGASASGLKYADTIAVVSGLSYGAPTGAAAAAGTHAITVGGGSADNYTLSYQNGTLSVAKAPLTVLADDKSKVYGDADPALSASFGGFKYDDTAAVIGGLTLSAPTGAAATAGTHAITVGGGSADNYTLGYQPGTLSVAKATLTVTADNQSKVYGAPDPVLTMTVSGFKYADTSAVVSGLNASAPAGAAATAGDHPISAAGGSAANYVFNYVSGDLNVAPAVLTYVASPATLVPGAPPPALSGTVTGFAYNDTLSSATSGQLTFTSTAAQNAAPGAYAIVGSGLSAPNYRFVQAASNDTALTTTVAQVLYHPTIANDVTFDSSDVYEKNFGTPRVCVAAGPLDSGVTGGDIADGLAIEWSRVRVSPNLSNCLGLGERNSCSDF